MLCAVPVCAALITSVNGTSSPAAWWSDAAPEEDVMVDELLSAIENILQTNNAAQKALLAAEHARLLQVHDNVTPDANAHAVLMSDNVRKALGKGCRRAN